jgi:hypothetical protein
MFSTTSKELKHFSSIFKAIDSTCGEEVDEILKTIRLLMIA